MPYIENYNTNPDQLQEGQVADLSPAVILSRTVDTAVGFGKVVAQGVATYSCKPAPVTVAGVLGITVRSQATGARESTPDIYPAGETAAIMRKGTIVVKVTDAGGVAAGDAVWVKLSDGTFSNADLGSSASLKLAGARWETAAANGALAVIRVNFDVPAVAGA